MVIRGRVENGVVVLDGDVSLPEGAVVTVVPGGLAQPVRDDGDVLSDEEHRRIIETMDSIAALPIEGSDEPFSGADHDEVLYRKP